MKGQTTTSLIGTLTLPFFLGLSLALWITQPSFANDELAFEPEPSSCTVNEEVSATLPQPAGGMASNQAFLRQASLNIYDFVLGYSPPIGPKVNFRLNYNYLEAKDTSAKRDFGNFGNGWTLNWVSFLKLDPKGNVTVMVPGGGSEYYPINTAKGEALFKHNLTSHALLVSQAEGGFERRLPDGSVEVYGLTDDSGRTFLTELRNPAGNAVRIGYDKWFRTVSVTDAIGQMSKIRYASETFGGPGFSKISEIEDPFGRKAKFTYDKLLTHLESSTDTVGLTSRFTYAPNSNSVVQLGTPYGTTKFSQYKPAGSPTGSLGLRVTYPDDTSTVTEHWAGERHATYQWNRLATDLYPSDPSKGVYSHCTITKWMTKPNGKELSVKASVKEPLESEVVYSYSGKTLKGFTGDSNLPASISRRVSVKNADGTVGSAIQTYAYQYNDFGKIIRQVDPVGRTISYKYAPNEIDLLETRQSKGSNNVLLSRFEYDDKHNPILAVNAAGSTTKFQYNKLGELIKTIDAKGNSWTSVYDTKGFLQALVGPLGSENFLGKFSYDSFGRLRTQIDVDGHALTLDYDIGDRLIKKTFEDGTSEQIKYDKLDAVSFQDRSGRITKRTYDSLDRMISITDPLGRTSRYEWCTCGALRKLIDPAGHSTEWHHDIAGRIVQKKFADGSEINYGYEKDGPRLLTRTDALKQETKYSYNVDNTVAEISYENVVNPTSSIKYLYDPDYSRLSSATNDFGSIRFDYNIIESKNGAGQLHSISNSGIPNSTISFAYDYAGRTINRSINGAANSVTREFDGLSRLVSDTSVLGEFKFEYADTPNKGTTRIANILFPNGVATRFKYDGSSGEERLQSITNVSSNVISQFEYGYDNVGQIVKWQERFNGKNSNNFALSYDAAGQLIDAVSQTAEVSRPQDYHYQYDLASNRTRAQSGGFIKECGYNTMNELINLANQNVPTNLEKVAGKQLQELTFDANGNLLFDGEKNYKWNAQNQLVKIIYGGNGKSTEFVYDAAGQLAKITELMADKAESVQTLLWSEGAISEVRDGNGDVIKKLFTLGENVSGKNIFFARDHLGSTRQTINGAGSVLSRFDYDPFGQLVAPTVEGLPDFQYSGYFTHVTSGLNLTLFRAYDSKLGRWISRDPIGEFGLTGQAESPLPNSKVIIASNLYNYAANNSIQYIDPLGLDESLFQQSTYVPGQYQTNATSAGQANGANNTYSGATPFQNNSYANTVPSSGLLSGGQTLGANTVGQGVGALPESGYRLPATNNPTPSAAPGTGGLTVLEKQAVSNYNLAHKAWEENPLKFLFPEPQKPACLRK